ncbi:hypothetical protein [Microbacterium sp. 22296]|uniref:hypothetical protein n=1 Tax=Microbacterium sp. 22296 TaxID=3453903 RepID=UPI003F862A85
MPIIPAVSRTSRSAPRGRRQVRLAADDLAQIVELALRATDPTARAVLAQIADRDGEGASEVITGILQRTSPRPLRPSSRPRASIATVERVAPAPATSLGEEQARRLAAVAGRLPQGGSVLFVGAEGTGKTLRARWMAHQRARAVTTIDLTKTRDVPLSHLVDAVASATASGMTVHLERAHSRDVEALAALVRARAAPGLLLLETTEAPVDLAVDAVVEVGAPDVAMIAALLRDHLGDVDERVIRVVAALRQGETPRAIEHAVEGARRFAAMTEIGVAEALHAATVQLIGSWPRRRRRDAAVALMQTTGLSQRAVRELTGVSRDTLRRHASSPGIGGGAGARASA